MTAPPHVLDVRIIPPPQRHRQVFDTFGALAPGEAFVLVVDHEPKPLLYQLQAEHPGGFEWNVLEGGPVRWRIEIVRRAPEGPRGVFEYLSSDHRRLDGILERVQSLVRDGSFEEARHRFGDFACGLRRHMDEEECVLFPVFERSTGMAQGPTDAMRAEHVEILRAVEAGTQALQRADAEGFRSAVDALTGTLVPHNEKEEAILYPACDGAAGGERERDDIVRKMQAL